MKQHEVFSYMYDFISQIMDNKMIFDSVKKIILFGSVARNDFSKESDIDIFIDVSCQDEEGEIQKQIKKEINIFETRCEKTWFLRGISAPIKPIVGDIESGPWKELNEEIAAYGKVIYGQYMAIPKKGKHYLLVRYELKRLEQKKKMGIIRALYGYATLKKGKKYSKKGLLEKEGGIKIGSNAFLIEKERWPPIKKIIHQYKVPYQLKEVTGS